MKEKKTGKVREFVTEHKDELIIAGYSVLMVVGIGAIVIGLKMPTKPKLEKTDFDKIDWDHFGTLGRVIKTEQRSRGMAWLESDHIDISNIKHTVSELGEVGEYIVEKGGGIFKPDDEITGILIYTK